MGQGVLAVPSLAWWRNGGSVSGVADGSRLAWDVPCLPHALHPAASGLHRESGLGSSSDPGPESDLSGGSWDPGRGVSPGCGVCGCPRVSLHLPSMGCLLVSLCLRQWTCVTSSHCWFPGARCAVRFTNSVRGPGGSPRPWLQPSSGHRVVPPAWVVSVVLPSLADILGSQGHGKATMVTPG